MTGKDMPVRSLDVARGIWDARIMEAHAFETGIPAPWAEIVPDIPRMTIDGFIEYPDYDVEQTGQKDTGLLPDVGFYVAAREHLVNSDKAYPFAPDLTVEIASPK
jgi:hypothetical protein